MTDENPLKVKSGRRENGITRALPAPKTWVSLLCYMSLALSLSLSPYFTWFIDTLNIRFDLAFEQDRQAVNIHKRLLTACCCVHGIKREKRVLVISN